MLGRSHIHLVAGFGRLTQQLVGLDTREVVTETLGRAGHVPRASRIGMIYADGLATGGECFNAGHSIQGTAHLHPQVTLCYPPTSNYPYSTVPWARPRKP